MSFSSNDTIKKLEKLLPESIHNQSVPKDVLVIIDDYIPKLNDGNIRKIVKDYLSKDEYLKQQVINNYGTISNWDVSQVTNMNNLFKSDTNKNYTNFNEDISEWNVSNVTNMAGMFFRAENFNKHLNNWNVSNVTNMDSMFYFAKSFNQPLNNWDVSKVTDMRGMFYYAFNFDQPLNNWNVSNVTNINAMFYNAKSFNQPLNNWNVSNVTEMYKTFYIYMTRNFNIQENAPWYHGSDNDYLSDY